MLYVSLILESLRAHPRLMFWTAALSQAALWTLLPTLFYSAPPGDLAITLAVGHEFQLGSDGGPPLAFWLAEIAYRLGRMPGVYLLSQACVVATLVGIFALGRSTVGTAQAVLAVLLMVGVAVMSVPTPEFGPAILAMPIWTMVLLLFWRAVGEGRSEYWIALAVGMGLLLLTTSLGWIFFLLLALFAAASARGRAAFRSIDPWLCAFVAILVAVPYLAWFAHADDIWKPALMRLQEIDPRAAAGQWLRILWNLSVAHVGVVVFAVLAYPWRLPRGGRLPTVYRPPMQPLAKSMIYFFALVPLLAATLAVVLLGQPWSLAAAGPLIICSGLAVIVMAGDKIPLYQQRLLSMAWIGFLAGPPLAMAIVLMVLPWTLAIDFKVLYPTNEMGRFFSETFERRTGKPLTIVTGDPDIAALIALDPRTRPSLLMEAPVRSRWVSVADARAKGAVIVWQATDTPGTPPPSIKASFPDLVVEVPRAFERSIQGRLPLLRIGWAVIRPQGAP
jgi:4-amino-4-deoxy-L-arabinose transferase-like glycosyltransferase